MIMKIRLRATILRISQLILKSLFCTNDTADSTNNEIGAVGGVGLEIKEIKDFKNIRYGIECETEIGKRNKIR